MTRPLLRNKQVSHYIANICTPKQRLLSAFILEVKDGVKVNGCQCQNSSNQEKQTRLSSHYRGISCFTVYFLPLRFFATYGFFYSWKLAFSSSAQV